MSFGDKRLDESYDRWVTRSPYEDYIECEECGEYLNDDEIFNLDTKDVCKACFDKCSVVEVPMKMNHRESVAWQRGYDTAWKQAKEHYEKEVKKDE